MWVKWTIICLFSLICRFVDSSTNPLCKLGPRRRERPQRSVTSSSSSSSHLSVNTTFVFSPPSHAVSRARAAGRLLQETTGVTVSSRFCLRPRASTSDKRRKRSWCLLHKTDTYKRARAHPHVLTGCDLSCSSPHRNQQIILKSDTNYYYKENF